MLKVQDTANEDNPGEFAPVEANGMGPVQAAAGPAGARGGSAAEDAAASPELRKRPRSVAVDNGSEEGGQSLKRRTQDADADAFDMLIVNNADEDVSAPLISFPRAALGETNTGEHWDSAPTAFPIASDTIDIEDMLQLPTMDRDSVWGDMDYPGLGRDTQYVQLHEARDQPAGQEAGGGGEVKGTHYIGSLLRANAGEMQATGAGDRVVANAASNELPGANAVGKAEVVPVAKAEATATQPAGPHVAGAQWGAYTHPSIPDPSTLETRTWILQPPTSHPTNAAIRIAPRDKSKADPAAKPEPSGRVPSPPKSNARPKSARQAPAIAPPIAPPYAQAPTRFTGGPSNGAANPAAAAAASMAAAMALGRGQLPPGASAQPHPMAGPLMFAQTASPPAGVPAGAFEFPGNVATASTSAPARTAASPSAPVGFPIPPGVFAPGTPMVPPGMMPGIMPVDPTSALCLAQYYYAALTSPGGSASPPAAFPDPAQAAFVAQTGLGHPLAAAPVRVSPRASAPAASVRAPAHPAVSPAGSAPGSTRPVFIADGVSHKVVEQQAPAKLMKHPVLGRLQLQSDQPARTSAQPALRAGEAESSSSLMREHAGGGGFQTGPTAFQGGAAAAQKVRRKRLVWTPELHDRFVQAINAIGISQAVPKPLVQIMNVEGLSTEHVKSHLQKYRNSLKKAAVEDAEDKAGKGPERMYVKSAPASAGAAAADARIMAARAAVAAGDGKAKLVDESTADGPKQDASKAAGATSAGLQPERAEPSSESAAGASPKAGNCDTARSSGGQESETQLQVQERTMQLQFELQVMVHRTVSLQKELQLAIEKQNAVKLARGAVSTEPASQDAEVKRETETGKEIDIDTLVKERMQMQRELERKTVLVKEEIDVIQKRLVEKKEKEKREGGEEGKEK